MLIISSSGGLGPRELFARLGRGGRGLPLSEQGALFFFFLFSFLTVIIT